MVGKEKKAFMEWTQSLIEIEIRLRETVQRESFLEEEYDRASQTSTDNKAFLQELSTELQSLKQEYWRLEREPCPIGPTRRAYYSFRRKPQWYLSSFLRRDCARRGGCCGRNCRCCEKKPKPHRSRAGVTVLRNVVVVLGLEGSNWMLPVKSSASRLLIFHLSIRIALLY